MLLRNRRGWEVPEAEATPEAVAMGRRPLLRGAAALALAAASRPALAADAAASSDPAMRFDPGRPITAETAATTYNNYYEFGESKDIWQAAQRLPQRPWSIAFDGMVKAPKTVAIDDLVKQVKIEERVYRHRCVEAWAMTVPWTGFQLSELVRLAEPLPSAKYLVFTTTEQPKYMPGLRMSWYPWPYTEGCTVPEAMNELAFIATGMYGKPLFPQDGGPIRLVLPWKYGFKSAKALIRVSFTDKQPVTFWEAIGPSEYGFWANVNPAVPHPRWSQATERLLGTGEIVPTRIYNGYGQWVAGLYTDLQNQKLFM